MKSGVEKPRNRMFEEHKIFSALVTIYQPHRFQAKCRRARFTWFMPVYIPSHVVRVGGGDEDKRQRWSRKVDDVTILDRSDKNGQDQE